MKTYKFSAFLLSALLLASCQSNGLAPQNEEENKVVPLTIHATMPDTDPSLRVVLEPKEGTKDLSARFGASEIMYVWFAQGDKVVEYGMGIISDITADGKQGNINLYKGVPEGIDAEKEYTVIGYLGHFLFRPKIQGNKLVMNLFSYNAARGSKFTPPVIFKTTNPGNLNKLDAAFEHIGAYEVLHLKNTSNKKITGYSLMVDADAKYITRSWAYDLIIEKDQPLRAHAWDIISNDKTPIVEVGRGGPLAESPEIATGSEAICYSWYIPKEDVKEVPKSRLILQIATKKYLGSEKILPARPQLKPGHAYHVYAEFTGEKLLLTSGSDNGGGDHTPIAVVSVSLDKAKATIKEGQTLNLKATITPANATNKELTWTSSNNDVATVNNNGLVKGLKAGKATITVLTTDGAKTATCEVTVEAPAEDDGVKVDPVPGENYYEK